MSLHRVVTPAPRAAGLPSPRNPGIAVTGSPDEPSVGVRSSAGSDVVLITTQATPLNVTSCGAGVGDPVRERREESSALPRHTGYGDAGPEVHHVQASCEVQHSPERNGSGTVLLSRDRRGGRACPSVPFVVMSPGRICRDRGQGHNRGR